MNSVIKNGSKLPQTTEAHFWRHLSSACKSMTRSRYSTSFPCTDCKRFRRKSSAIHVIPPEGQRVTLKVQKHSKVAQDQRHHGLPLHCTYQTQPPRLSKKCLGPTCGGKRECPRTLLQNSCWTGHMLLPRPKHPTTTAGTFHWAKTTEKKFRNEKLEQIRHFPQPCVFCSEQLRILTITALRDQHTLLFKQLEVTENCAHNCSTSS